MKLLQKLMNRPMRCPYCGHILVPGEMRRFETIADHVSDPNATDYPLRNTWICVNQKCFIPEHTFWDSDGGAYGMHKLGDHFSLPKSAKNSFWRRIEKEQALLDKFYKFPKIVKIIRRYHVKKDMFQYWLRSKITSR